MKKTPIPTNELERIEALKRYSIMDSLPENEYDSITKLASFICETPISLVSLLDEERQWFKSSVGLDAKQTAREISFCQYAIMADDVYEVSNALENDTFNTNPLVTGDPNIRFYAGAPLKDQEGYNLGTLCVIDTVPRTLTSQQKESLKLLSYQVVSLLKLRKSNEELVRAQLEFKNFTELSKDLVCIANIDGDFRKVNPAFTAVLGYSREELEGQSFLKFIHPDDLNISINEVEKLSQGHKTISFENRYRCKNGDYVTLSWNSSPDPHTGNIYCIARDMTLEKEAEKNLISSKLLLDDSQRIAKIGSWKFDIKSNELIWSKGHYLIFELEETSLEELNNAYRSRIYPDDLKLLDELQAEFEKSYEDFKINYRIIFPDGRIKHILEIGSSYRDGKGNVIGMQGNVQDVTEIKLAEIKLADKAKEINDVRAALDESSIVTITDHNGVLNYVNDKFCIISQFTREELIGQHHYIDASGNYASMLVEKIWLSIASGNIWKGELKQIAKDGSYYWVATTIVPFLNKQGVPYQYIAISSDITQEKLAQESLQDTLKELQKTNKELDQFAYVVSHDLKAPLRAINNLAEWILEEMPEMPADVSNYFDLLCGRILRMENLINGVLDYSRIGRTKIEKEVINLDLMLAQIVDTLVPNKGYEVTVEPMPEIYNAKILIYQIFSNLIGNAVKYNDKPIGVIKCSYESLDGFYQFTITDNGPGINKNYHKKVFGVFQTIEARDKKESTGIGLSIVQKIIDEKGGTIRIESEENKGASFIFTIPK